MTTPRNTADHRWLASDDLTDAAANLARYTFAGMPAGTTTIPDGSNFALGTTSGTKFGTATSQKLSFYGVTAVVQPTTATAVGSTAATQTTPYGYTTSAQADGIVTLLNSIRADLVTLGLVR